MSATILHHHLAIDVAAGIRNQKTRKIGKLAMFADPAKRIPRCPVVVAAFGPELTGGPGRWKSARRDRYGSDALWSPLHSQAFGHRQNGRLGHRGRPGESAAGNR